MDDHTDDRDSGPPPVGTPEELEEALKWLEELTARQGKPAEPATPASSASLDSPFRGLIDSEDGDLPDWLREVPSTPGQAGLEETEPESRLDWLAKMAQRESIEELPTLEWRRLSEPSQSAILAAHGQIDLPQSDESDEEEPDEAVDELIVDDMAIDDEAATSWTDDLAPVTPSLDAAGETEESSAADVNLDEIEDQIADEAYALGESLLMEETAADEEASTPDEPTERAAYDEFETDLPPIDDLDAAMAWIEELAVSQDTPLEDLPSVADRALASQLMAEAGIPLSASPLDEIGSDSDMLDSLTPPHPFIEEEDYADTVVLVETLAAEEYAGQRMIDEVSSPFSMEDQVDGPDMGDDVTAEAIVLGAITSFDESAEAPTLDEPTDEISFEEAMALLDEMAAEPAGPDDDTEFAPVELEAVVESLPEWVDEPVIEFVETTTTIIEVETEVDPEPESGSADEAWDYEESDDDADDGLLGETPLVAPVILIADAEPEYFNGRGYSPLEEALQSLDAIALPPGKSMDDIDASLRTAQMTPWRDVNSALAWLESTLVVEAPSSPLLETEAEVDSLIAQMPEDPDAVLAWLEQMAGDDDSLPAMEAKVEPEPPSRAGAGQSEPLIEELAEVDLLNMPEDPDEAMAWLEGLAREATPIEEAPTSIEEAPTVAFFQSNELAAIGTAAVEDEETVESLAEQSEQFITELAAEDEVLVDSDVESPEIMIEAAEPAWETDVEMLDHAPVEETQDEGEAVVVDEAVTVVIDAEDSAGEPVVDIAITEAELADVEGLVDEADEWTADETQPETPAAEDWAGEPVLDIAITEAELADVEDLVDEADEWTEDEAQPELPAADETDQSEALVITIDADDSAVAEGVVDIAIAEAEMAQADDSMTEAAEWLESEAQPEAPLVVEVEAEEMPEEEPAAPREEESLSWLDLLKPLD